MLSILVSNWYEYVMTRWSNSPLRGIDSTARQKRRFRLAILLNCRLSYLETDGSSEYLTRYGLDVDDTLVERIVRCNTIHLPRMLQTHEMGMRTSCRGFSLRSIRYDVATSLETYICLKHSSSIGEACKYW